MTTIIPEGEDLKKAVKWISERRQDDPESLPGKLVEDAAVRFDLSPADTEFLYRFVREEK